MRLLLLDGRSKNWQALKRVLEQNLYTVDCHANAIAGSFLSRLETYDLVIVDADVTPLGARTVCLQLRQAERHFPILVIGTVNEPEEIAACLNAGADDYLRRPFALVEVIARIRALLRRSPLSRKRSIQIEDVCVDTKARVVHRRKKEVHLTKTEYKLLEFLAEREGEIVAKDDIIEYLWGPGTEIKSNVLEMHISALRKKIDSRRKEPLLKNFTGRGYRLG